MGVQALYLRATSNIYEIPYTLYANNSNLNYGVSNGWNWGFQLNGAYMFETGNDLTLNWYRFHNSNSSTHAPGSASWIYPSGNSVSVDLINSQATNQPQWDQVNIELGQIFEYGTKRNLRFHAGAQYSRVANQVTWIVLQKLTIPSLGQINYLSNTLLNAVASFNGFGPRVGIDFNYASACGLGAYAKGALAMLAGSTKSNYVGDNVVGMNTSLPRVIPAIDAKLGLNYNKPFYSGVLTADIGWLWVNYINALPYSNDIKTTPGTTSSFEVQGLYFGLNYTV